MDLQCGYFASSQYKSAIEDAYKKVDDDTAAIFNNLVEKYPDWGLHREKLKVALIFEATKKLVTHPTDLIGFRRLKLLEESLNKVEKNKGKTHKLKRIKHISNNRIRHLLSNCLELKPVGIRSKILTSSRILMKIALVILAVNVFDYVQDFKFVKTFWMVGGDGKDLQESNTDQISSFILLRFYAPAMFLTIVMVVSSILVMFQLPSLRFRYNAEKMMNEAEIERMDTSVNPMHVMNQHNFSLTEASKESIWQLMVQWGVYFRNSWFITWRLSLSTENEKDLEDAHEILNISNLYLSLVSSILSISVGQFRAHNITTEYSTSTKQKIIYFFSCVMSTICNVLTFIVTHTANVELGVGRNIYQENSASYQSIIILLLLTPMIHDYLILPTSNRYLRTPSMDCPSFYEAMSKQCLILSFYIGLCAIVNSYMYGWGPELEPNFGEIAFNITKNPEYLGRDNFLVFLTQYDLQKRS